MTDYTITRDWSDTISFDRLHALAKRGYRPCLGTDRDDSGFRRIDLRHPKTFGRHTPPKITLWSNGIVATQELLWPSRHVRQDDGHAPLWQKFINESDEALFANFVDSVPQPSVVDLYLYPGVLLLKGFLGRLLIGVGTCCTIAFILIVLRHLLAVD